MEIIPAVDIRGGNCVQLVQGDYARERVFGDDPVAMAQRWAAEGARRLHVVDLDGAREGRPVNRDAVARIVRDSKMRVQVAGGIREAGSIDAWADAGADRIVIGTLAVDLPDAVEAAVRRHGDRIAVAVDARDGRVAVKGWTETTGTSVADFIRAMRERGVGHFIYTDIGKDGMLEHPGFEAVPDVLEMLDDATLIYSGGVTSVEDVVRLAEFELEGAIIGTALYDGRIELREARAAIETSDDW